MDDQAFNTESVAADQLRAFVERIEHEEAFIADHNANKSEIYKEAKGAGYDVKVIRKVVSLRKRDYAERQEEEAILDLYLRALGMV